MSEIASDNTTSTLSKKRKRRTHSERTEESDQRMFEAAKQLILEVGSQKTTLKEIGEKAGYSRGLANARFGSKDKLFAKLTDQCRRHYVGEILAAADGKDGIYVLISRLDGIASYAKKYPDEARVMYTLWFESVGVPSEINANLARFHEQAREDIKNITIEVKLISGRDRDAKAHRYATRFCGVMFGLCYQWLVNPDAVDIQKNIEDIKNEILSKM